jgi:penicillin-binding protein 1B
MVGGRNYLDSQFNRAADAKRQPGSSIKPFVYAAALTSGEHDGKPITLAQSYMDEPKEFEGGYAPKNFGGSYLNRPVTAREALARSLNVITVSLAQETGYSAVAETIGKCGIPRPPAQGASALGASEATPLEMASAYSVFANGGQRVVPLAINRIADSEGRQIHQSKQQRIEALSPQVAHLVLSAMQSAITEPYGTGRAASQLGLEQMAGKTGTSQRSDAWFAGITPRIVCIPWVGFDDNRSLEMTGGHAALPMWNAFMKEVVRLRPDLISGSFDRPEGIVERVIDPTTGQRATDQCPEKKIELFIEGREVEEVCVTHPGKPIEELPPTIIPIESTPTQPNAEPPSATPPKPATEKKEPKTRPKFARQRPGRNGPP